MSKEELWLEHKELIDLYNLAMSKGDKALASKLNDEIIAVERALGLYGEDN